MTEQQGAGDRPMSYAEKYRGTEWGRPEPPPPPSSPRRGRRVVAIVAVVAIAAAGVGIAALALSPSPPGATHPSAPLSAGGASGGPTPSPTPSPTADPGKAVLDRFWAIVGAKDLSYHMTAKGKSVFDKKTIETYKESIDVVGDEYSGWIDSSVTPKSAIARRDGVVWVKMPGKPRVGRQTTERYFRLTPFMYIHMPAWIDYVRPVTVDGRHLHLLRTNGFYRPDIARLLDFQRFPVVPDEMTLDLYVTDEGVPVSAAFTADAIFGDSTRQRVFHGRSDFVFSKVGAKLKITVPKR
jgi:hypothetical protein